MDKSDISVSVGFECKPASTLNHNIHNTCIQDDFNVDYAHKVDKLDGSLKFLDSERKHGLWTENDDMEVKSDIPRNHDTWDVLLMEDKARTREDLSKGIFSDGESDHDDHFLEKSLSEPERSRASNSIEDSFSEDIVSCDDAMETDSSEGSCRERLEPDTDSEEVYMSVGLGCVINRSAEAKKQEMGNLSNIDEEEELECFQEDTDNLDLVPDVDLRVLSATSDLGGGRRGIPNTPASFLADTSNGLRNVQSRIADLTTPSSVVTEDTTRACESREAIFRRALSLMSTRCTNDVGNNMGVPLIDVNEPPFGVHVPVYFHIHQNKPSPMAPLKAWRGYHGNVYFEPIAIKGIQEEKESKFTSPNWREASTDSQYQQMMSTRRLRSSGRPATTPPSRSNTRLSARSSAISQPQTQQQSVLQDKHMLSHSSEPSPDDVQFKQGLQDTGSLNVRTEQCEPISKKQPYNREKICKGSVAHKLKALKEEKKEQEKKKNPLLKVSGDKFSPALSMSPLLRTTTQYSYSNQRLTMNSPDPYHSAFEHLPPLEQVRVSLRHMDNLSDGSYGRKVTITEELKPFIKYSPDVKAKYQRQVHYLS